MFLQVSCAFALHLPYTKFASHRWMITTERTSKRWGEGKKKERNIFSMKERSGLPQVIACVPVAALLAFFVFVLFVKANLSPQLDRMDIW